MKAFLHTFENCVEADRKNILVLYDETTAQFLEALSEAGAKADKTVRFVQIPVSENHGTEPGKDVLEQMLRSDAVMCLTRCSLAHTSARNALTNQGIPFLSMPDYNERMLHNPALMTDYHAALQTVKRYADLLTGGSSVRITTEMGTELFLDIRERTGNCCPGLVNREYLLGSPPDIEANVAPVEENSNGILVIDGSITDYRLGLLKEPLRMPIKDGRIEGFDCTDPDVCLLLDRIFQTVHSDRAYYIGEFGIGFNRDAVLCGNMLIDEGAKGCVHFGMGSNWTIGGANNVGFHLDFVMKNATVFVDDLIIIDNGVLTYEG